MPVRRRFHAAVKFITLFGLELVIALVLGLALTLAIPVLADPSESSSQNSVQRKPIATDDLAARVLITILGRRPALIELSPRAAGALEPIQILEATAASDTSYKVHFRLWPESSGFESVVFDAISGQDDEFHVPAPLGIYSALNDAFEAASTPVQLVEAVKSSASVIDNSVITISRPSYEGLAGWPTLVWAKAMALLAYDAQVTLESLHSNLGGPIYSQLAQEAKVARTTGSRLEAFVAALVADNASASQARILEFLDEFYFTQLAKLAPDSVSSAPPRAATILSPGDSPLTVKNSYRSTYVEATVSVSRQFAPVDLQAQSVSLQAAREIVSGLSTEIAQPIGVIRSAAFFCAASIQPITSTDVLGSGAVAGLGTGCIDTLTGSQIILLSAATTAIKSGQAEWNRRADHVNRYSLRTAGIPLNQGDSESNAFKTRVNALLNGSAAAFSACSLEEYKRSVDGVVDAATSAAGDMDRLRTAVDSGFSSGALNAQGTTFYGPLDQSWTEPSDNGLGGLPEACATSTPEEDVDPGGSDGGNDNGGDGGDGGGDDGGGSGTDTPTDDGDEGGGGSGDGGSGSDPTCTEGPVSDSDGAGSGASETDCTPPATEENLSQCFTTVRSLRSDPSCSSGFRGYVVGTSTCKSELIAQVRSRFILSPVLRTDYEQFAAGGATRVITDQCESPPEVADVSLCVAPVSSAQAVWGNETYFAQCAAP